MTCTIYQLYFNHSQIQYLEPKFVPFDNTENLTPHLREYPLLKKCFDLSIKNNIDLWGAMPWSFRWKFEISADEIINHINHNPGFDIYFINPMTNHVPVIYNVWEQGQWCHPEIVTLANKLLNIMGYDPKILYKPMTRQNMFFGSMCVANNFFWQNYFEFVEKYIAAIVQLDNYLFQIHEGDAQYRNTGIGYFPFIQERLFSTFLLIYKNKFKICAYHANEQFLPTDLHRLNMLKSIAVERNDLQLLKYWCVERQHHRLCLYPDSKNLALDWINYDLS